MARCELAKFHKSLRQLLISLLIHRYLHAIACFAGLIASAAHSLPCNLRNMKSTGDYCPRSLSAHCLVTALPSQARTWSVVTAKAFHQHEVGLHSKHHGVDIDLLRHMGKAHAAFFATHRD